MAIPLEERSRFKAAVLEALGYLRQEFLLEVRIGSASAEVQGLT